MREQYFLVCLIVSVLYHSSYAQKPQKAPTSGGGAPPPAGGEDLTGRSGGAEPPDYGQFAQIAAFGQGKYQISNKVMSFTSAFYACNSLNKNNQTAFRLFDLHNTSPDNIERQHITAEIAKKGVDCVWVSTQIKSVNGRKVAISETPHARRLNIFDPTHFGDPKARNSSGSGTSTPTSTGKPPGAAPAPGKKVKRQVTMKNGVKMITMVATQTLFPWVKDLKNETNDCYPGCKPKECTITRAQDECDVITLPCSMNALPKCEILGKDKACSGGCDNCTIESVHCFVRTQNCLASRGECKVIPPSCTLTKSACEVVRPSCVSYSKPCNVSLPPNRECTAEAVCVNRTDSYCKVIVDPECAKMNDSAIHCARIFNCTLDPVCIKPILCRPPVLRCPPMETFCPPPVIKCPPPVIACEKPVVACPDPVIVCPTPDVVCTRPKVICSAPVIRCSQVLATCGNPEVTCPPPRVTCPNPKIKCDSDPGDECPPPPVNIEICTPPRCEGECQCVRLAKSLNYGMEPCSCNEQCVPLCEF